MVNVDYDVVWIKGGYPVPSDYYMDFCWDSSSTYENACNVLVLDVLSFYLCYNRFIINAFQIYQLQKFGNVHCTCNECNQCNVMNTIGWMQYDECNITNKIWRMEYAKWNMMNAICQMKYDEWNMTNAIWSMLCDKYTVTTAIFAKLLLVS